MWADAGAADAADTVAGVQENAAATGTELMAPQANGAQGASTTNNAAKAAEASGSAYPRTWDFADGSAAAAPGAAGAAADANDVAVEMEALSADFQQMPPGSAAVDTVGTPRAESPPTVEERKTLGI